MKKLIILLIIATNFANAQNIVVKSKTKVMSANKKAFYHPQFLPDGKQILLTSENYKGLNVLNLKTKELKNLNKENGAGYKPEFSADGKNIYYKTHEFKERKKYYSVKKNNIEGEKETILVSKKRTAKISIPRKKNSKTEYLSVKTIDKKIVLKKNSSIKKLTPLGDCFYIWTSISPDKTKILFNAPGKGGTFVCNLEGEIIKNIGFLNAPKWLNNKWVIGMRDIDDGHQLLESDIYAISLANPEKAFPLTNTKNEIELEPDCSNNNEIVYYTTKGDIYILEIELD